MHLGELIQRDYKRCTSNYKLNDAIRLQRIKKNRHNNINNSEIMKVTLNTIIEQNVTLLHDSLSMHMTKEQRNEHLYWWKEINKLLNTMLHDNLSITIFKCHISIIQLITSAEWINDIGTLKFGSEKNTTSNILLYILENCCHQSDY